MKKEELIGRSIIGFRFESSDNLIYTQEMEKFVGTVGGIYSYHEVPVSSYLIKFGSGVSFYYPAGKVEEFFAEGINDSKEKELNKIIEDDLYENMIKVTMAELRGETKKITIDESISLLESAISRMMQFESTSDKNDFLLDVVKEYKKELANPNARSEEFAELTKPLIKYLNDKQDPHTKIIIDCTSAEMVKGELGFSTNEYVND